MKGPIFANIILADGINRTPPKTQAALLESMQEYAAYHCRATIQPFFVLATQNPIERVRIPCLKHNWIDLCLIFFLTTPRTNKKWILLRNTTADDVLKVTKVLTAEEIISFQHLVRRVPIADNVVEYAVKLSQATRPGTQGSAIANEFFRVGCRTSRFSIPGIRC